MYGADAWGEDSVHEINSPESTDEKGGGGRNKGKKIKAIACFEQAWESTDKTAVNARV